MTSRLSRLRAAAESVERAEAEQRRVTSAIRRYEVGLLIEKVISPDELSDLTREVHAGDEEALHRFARVIAAAEARWEAGERLGGNGRELLDREQRESRQRLRSYRP